MPDSYAAELMNDKYGGISKGGEEICFERKIYEVLENGGYKIMMAGQFFVKPNGITQATVFRRGPSTLPVGWALIGRLWHTLQVVAPHSIAGFGPGVAGW